MATLAKLLVQLGLQDDLSDGLKGVSANVTKFGRSMMTYATLPILAAGAAAVKWGSDLNESMSAANTVFGSNGNAIMKWSQTTAQTLGIARSDALTAATQFAGLGKAANLTNDQLVPFSTSLVQAGADLSSFWNIPTGTVLSDLQSGLVGQYEPLLKYNILLNENAVLQKAMEMTGKANSDQITSAEKVLARYTLIMEGLGAAEGDRARTSAEFAGQMRTLTAQVKDTAATFGMILLPVLTSLASNANDLAVKFGSLSTTQQKWILITAGIVAAIGPVLMVLGQLVLIAPAIGTAFTIMTGPVGLVIAALAALFIAYQTNFLGFADGVNAAAAKVSQTFTDLQPTIQAVADVMTTAFTAALPILTNVFDLVVTHVTETFQNVKQILDGYTNIIRGIMQVIKGIFTGDWGLIKTGVTNIVTGMKDVVGGILNQLVTDVKFILGIVKMSFSLAWNAIKDKAGEVVSGMTANVVGLLNGLATDGFNAMFNAGYQIGNGIIAGISAIWSSVVGYAESLAGAAWDAIQNKLHIKSPSELTTWAGEMMGAGLADGMKGSEQKVSAAANSMAGAALTGMTGPTVHGGMTFNITGSKDPKATANEIFSIFTREMALTTGGV